MGWMGWQGSANVPGHLADTRVRRSGQAKPDLKPAVCNLSWSRAAACRTIEANVKGLERMALAQEGQRAQEGTDPRVAAAIGAML